MLNLNGVELPSFVKVNSIEFSVLPPVTNNSQQIRGRKSQYFFNQQVGLRKISANVTIISEAANGIMAKAGELAAWLYNEEPVPLIISDEPTKTWMVLPDGETNINEVHTTGTVTIDFVCTEPFAYGAEHVLSFSPTDDEPFYFTVEGNADTYAEIELTLTANDVDTITLISDNGQVMLGEQDDVAKPITNKLPTRISDDASNVSLWTTASAVDGGVVAGTFVSNGSAFIASGDDYGTGTGWHGPSMIRSLTTPITNFEVETWITLNSLKKDELGRVELYLLDENNEQFGKVSLVDFYKAGDWPKFEARAGAYSGGHSFINDLRKTGIWTNFYGTLLIGRNGKKWYATISQYDTKTKKFHARLHKEWNDNKHLYTTPKLAKVQIHVGAYSTNKKYANVGINSVNVKEHVVLSASQAPLLADSGVKFLIDCNKSIVYKDGKPCYDLINPVTQFFGLNKGVNGLAISPAVATVTVTYKERWM